VLNGNEKKYVNNCFDINWISSSGNYITQFEETFSRYCGANYGVSCSSGTSAIHLALAALGIGPGDEVIIPCFTLIASANIVILAGAKPVFVDVDPDNWCIDSNLIEAKITRKTKAIMVVHMYGHPCDMDSILQIARQNNLFVIEDSAQAHGTEYKGKMVGCLGDIGCFSFYATKPLTTGEGGMVLTDNPEWAERMRAIRSQGFVGDSRNYIHDIMGYNYRLTNIQAGIGLAQCEMVEQKINKKRAIARMYTELLSGCRELTLQKEEEWAKSTFWNFTVVIEREGINREQLADKLIGKGIQTRLTFKALHNQPLFNKTNDPRYPDISGNYPVSERLSIRGLCLPSGLNLENADIERVTAELLRDLEKCA
jgi:perosamine synthetase